MEELCSGLHLLGERQPENVTGVIQFAIVP
jgi:hypothetical protein